MVVCKSIGAAAGFLVGPAMVKKPGDIPSLLYFHVGFAWVTMIAIGIYFPASPPTPPSAAEATKWAADAAISTPIASSVVATNGHGNGHSNGHSNGHQYADSSSVNPEASALLSPPSSNGELSFLAGCLLLMKNASFMVLALSGGISQGVWNAWTGVLLTILSPMGYSQDEAGISCL
jgi:hypothetical protein